MKENPSGIIHKSDKQLLREAGAKILQLEKEAEDGVKTIEQLGIWNARLRVSLMAVGIHFKISPFEMQQIVTPYLDKQLSELEKQMAEIKAKFVEDVKAGKKVEFIINDNVDKAPEAPKE